MNYSYAYFNLIFRAKNRVIDPLMEGHHSVPKHWFLKNRTKKDYDHTIVYLTYREHFVAHRLLCKMFPNSDKAKFSLLRMMNTKPKQAKYKITNRYYEKAKRDFIKLIKEIRSDPIRDESRRLAVSAAMKNRWIEDRTTMQAAIIKLRNSPEDMHRRQRSSEAMKLKHINGLTDDTIKRNTGMNHMSEDQKKNMLCKAAEYRSSEAFVANSEKLKRKLKSHIAVIDNEGNNHFVLRTEYEVYKGIKYHHVNSKQARCIRSRQP